MSRHSRAAGGAPSATTWWTLASSPLYSSSSQQQAQLSFGANNNRRSPNTQVTIYLNVKVSLDDKHNSVSCHAGRMAKYILQLVLYGF